MIIHRNKNIIRVMSSLSYFFSIVINIPETLDVIVLENAMLGTGFCHYSLYGLIKLKVPCAHQTFNSSQRKGYIHSHLFVGIYSWLQELVVVLLQVIP